MKKTENNLAFIDGQNLHLGTTQDNWKIDHKKFRVYLKDKYKISEAYYFLGYILVDYLIKKDRFKKILFPNKKFASSLYKSLSNKFFDYLDRADIRTKIEYEQR